MLGGEEDGSTPGGPVMEHISYILIATAAVSFTVVCLNWHPDRWA
jgi:hypothetical protein